MDQLIGIAGADVTDSKFIVAGAGVKRLSMIVLDLSDEEAALELAKRLAEQTGRNVTIRDADGEVLQSVRCGQRN